MSREPTTVVAYETSQTQAIHLQRRSCNGLDKQHVESEELVNDSDETHEGILLRVT